MPLSPTLRAASGRLNPRPRGPRRLSSSPGRQSTSTGAVATKPWGAESVYKSGTGRTESDPSLASRYCRTRSQVRGTGNSHVATSIFKNKLEQLSFPDMHIAMLSWRYNNFNLLSLEEP